ncbi:MAG TPA: hypothetical protein VFF39_12265 [Verrucomicrobiae bacterium]|nr:hypothetical protein [Verrucomicrobiae bacterium]
MMTDQLNSKNLVPFKKRRGAYSIPGMTGEDEEHLIDQVDHDLSSEERRFIRHYVSYADTLLKRIPYPELMPQEEDISSTPGNVTAMPTAETQRSGVQNPEMTGPDSDKTDSGKKDSADQAA